MSIFSSIETVEFLRIAKTKLPTSPVPGLEPETYGENRFSWNQLCCEGYLHVRFQLNRNSRILRIAKTKFPTWPPPGLEPETLGLNRFFQTCFVVRGTSISIFN